MKFAFYNGYRRTLIERGAEYAADYAERQGFSSVEMLEGTQIRKNSCFRIFPRQKD